MSQATGATSPTLSESRFPRLSLDWVLLAALIGLSPLLVVHGQNLWTKPHFQFFPIVVAAFVYLIVSRQKMAGSLPRWREWAGLFLIGTAFLLAAFAVVIFSPWLAHVTLVMLCLGWMLLRLRENRWWELLAWTALLLIALPLPLNLDLVLVQKLQAISASSASALMDLFWIPHLARGNIIEVRSGELFVDEACSGVDSLYSLMALALLIAIWQRQSFVPSLLMLLTVPLWAWLGNVTRIVTIVLLLNYAGVDLTHGAPHTLLGLCIFAGSFACLILTNKFLRMLLDPFPAENPVNTPVHAVYNKVTKWPASSRSERSRNRSGSPQTEATVSDTAATDIHPRFMRGLAIGFACVFLGAGLKFMGIGRSDFNSVATLPSIADARVQERFSQNSIDFSQFNLQVLDFQIEHRETGSFFGEHSAVWRLVDGRQQLTVSIDFPFVGFHPLEACYLGAGNRLVEPVFQDSVGDSGTEVNVARFENDLDLPSFLFFLEFDQAGKIVANDANTRISRVLSNPPVVFQVQVYIEGSQSLTQAEESKYKQLVVHAYQQTQPIIADILQP